MPELSRFDGMVIIVAGWLAHHEEEAYKAWNQAVRGEHFEKIPPM